MIVRLLLSSPAMLRRARESAKAVFWFNQDSVEELGLFVNCSLGRLATNRRRPKPYNKQSPYHMFSGIMWNRFGTPRTLQLGTKEELTLQSNAGKLEGVRD